MLGKDHFDHWRYKQKKKKDLKIDFVWHLMSIHSEVTSPTTPPPHTSPPRSSAPRLVLHWPSNLRALGILQCGWASGDLFICNQCGRGRDNGWVWWGKFGLRLQGAGSCASTGPSQMWHTCLQAQDCGVWMSTKRRQRKRRKTCGQESIVFLSSDD